jgi:hypothetical protein
LFAVTLAANPAPVFGIRVWNVRRPEGLFHPSGRFLFQNSITPTG